MKFIPATILLGCLLLFTLGNACKKKEDPDPGNTPTPAVNYDFTWSGNLIARQPVNFTSSNVVVGSDKLLWQMDGKELTDTNPVHVFAEGGTYEVTLIVNGDNAHKVTKSISIEKDVRFQYTATQPFIGDTIRFFTTNANAGTTFEWDFGDGSKSTDAAPLHIYQNFGTYHIKLRVNNQYNAIAASFNYSSITVQKDPLYTHKITGSRAWQFNNYFKYSNGFDTSYTTSETFSIEAVDKVTVAMNSNATLSPFMWLEYSPSLSTGNVLVFTHFNRKLYFDHVMDTLYLSDWNHYGKGNDNGVPMYDHYITGSSK